MDETQSDSAPRPVPAPIETAEQLQLLTDNVTDYAVFLADTSGQKITWNVGVERITGYTEAEFLGRPPDLLFTPEDRECGAHFQEMRAAVAGGRAEDERWHLRKDGSRFWGSGIMTALRDASGALRGFCKIVRDETRRKQAEDALRQSEEQLRLLVEGARDYTMVMLDARGRIVRWNTGAERILGWPEAEVLGQDIAFIYTPEDREAGAPEHEIETARDQGRAENVRWHLRRDGSRFFADGAMAALREEDGRLRGFAKLMRDVTERHAAEEALQAEYERSRRIAQTLQRAVLLPVEADAFPGLETASFYQAALDEAQVGGDFFDAFSLGEAKVALAVGDASGKGLDAAARTIAVNDALRAFLRSWRGASVAGVLERLNELVWESRGSADDSTFVTLALVILDTATGEAGVATAGAEPPLVLRAGGEAQEVRAGGLPLGALPGQSYETRTLRLMPGDTVVLATDGITEARRGGEFLGYEGMVQIATGAAASASLHEMGRAILDGAVEFAGGALRDDACLLLARRCEEPLREGDPAARAGR